MWPATVEDVCVVVELHTWSHCRGGWSMLLLISVVPAPVPQLCGIQTFAGWTCWPQAEAWLQTVSGWRCSGWSCCSLPRPAPCQTHPAQTDPPSQGFLLQWCCMLWWWSSLRRWPPPWLRSQWRRWRPELHGRQNLLIAEEDGLCQKRRKEGAAEEPG